MSNEAMKKTIMPIGVISGSWSTCISGICINIESCVCSYSIF